MKQDLDVGDTLPTTMMDIQAANWYAQGMLSLVKSSYGSIDRLQPYFYLRTPRGPMDSCRPKVRSQYDRVTLGYFVWHCI